MCGLVFTTTACPSDDLRWRQAMASLTCRGPDATGESHSYAYAAGHCRLAVIGLGKAGRQPYSRDMHKDLLLFTGEVFNYRELGRELGFEPQSDTQVVYELLKTRPLQDLSRLRGMFAFTYWQREPELIVTCRDYFGIKPLYAAQGADGMLAFASVPSALAPLIGSREPDAVAIAGFLATGYFRDWESPLSTIRKLPPRIVTTWRRAQGYWHAEHQPLPILAGDRLDPLEAVQDSVRAHLVSDVPVGVLLSGGIDSTLLASFAADEVPNIRSFCLVNPLTPSIDEGRTARWNASVLGLEHTEVAFEPSRALATMTALVRSTGEPFGDAAYIPLAELCERVAADMKVVLAGEGADELFAGYRRYDVERYRYHPLARNPLRTLARSIGGQRRYEHHPPSMTTRTWAHWASGDDYLAHSYLMSGEWGALGDSPAALAAYDQRRRAWTRSRRLNDGASVGDHRLFDLEEWLPNVFLEKSDRASMLRGVEVRVPYLDPVVARAALATDPRNSRKSALRDGLLARHPRIRLPRRKMGLAVDTPRLMSASGLDEYAQYAVHDPSSVVHTLGLADDSTLAERAGLNPALRFRLGMLGLWQSEFLA